MYNSEFCTSEPRTRENYMERITWRELLETLQRSDFICMRRKFGNTGAKMITYL